MHSPVLVVNNLRKVFGTTTVVDGISFEIQKGEIVGLLGPNGAGKTTTIHMLLGITQASGGTIQYFGKDFFQNREYCLQKINFTSTYNTLQGRITVYENLRVFANLYNVKNAEKKIREHISYFEIDHLLNKRYWDLSAGQKTRVNIVKSLLNEPDLLLMDEPTASLDPDIADKTLSLIENLKKTTNISILYTSHNMDEVTRICDRVIFLDRGTIVAQDTPLNLTKQIATAKLQLTFEGKKSDVKEYLVKHNSPHTFVTSNIVVVDTEEKMIPKILFGISKTDIYVTDIEVIKPKLEDVFLDIARGNRKQNPTL